MRTERSRYDGPKHARGHRPRVRWAVLAAVLLLLAPAIYSYTTTMLRPSSLPLGVRSVEWLRAHHGNWVVDEVEHYLLQLEGAEDGRPATDELADGRPGTCERARYDRATHEADEPRDVWPPRIEPVFAHPLPGEGVWKRTGPLVGRTPAGPRHDLPHRARLSAHRRLRRLVRPHANCARLLPRPLRAAERARPRADAGSRTAQRWRLLATFNGGFTYSDGHNGSSIDGRTYEPLQDGLATADRLPRRPGRHQDLDAAGRTPAASVAFARQSLPLIVQSGRLNPALNDSTQWGFTLGNAVRVWRTGVGIDRRGNLIYAAADDQTVITLAQILKRAGAVDAMQFDINPEWPSLITYSHRGGLGPTKVVPNVQQPATRYLVPDDRDFFAVYTRLPGPVTVPFR